MCKYVSVVYSEFLFIRFPVLIHIWKSSIIIQRDIMYQQVIIIYTTHAHTHTHVYILFYFILLLFDFRHAGGPTFNRSNRPQN